MSKMILGLFIINFFTLLKFKILHKKDYIFIIHPLVYFFVTLLWKYFLLLKKTYFYFQEERRIIKEIPALTDFFKSYLQAGLLLPQAATAVLKQKKWCTPIQTSLSNICNNYAQGKSFKESLSHCISIENHKESRQYLHLLYLSLKVGYSTGENITDIIEKVKHKTQDRLNLNRKLKIMTAQMRLQCLIIILSPLFLAFIIYFMAPEYISFFFRGPVGNILLLLMILLNVLGFYFLNRILKIR